MNAESITNYRLLVPITKADEYYMNEVCSEFRLDSDGSPFSGIYYGFLVPKEEAHEYNQRCNSYMISERFESVDDFVTDFMDGDFEEDDFTGTYEE